MSEDNNFWFHCGRCGSLFRSRPGDLENRLCSKCGFDPSHGMIESPVEAAPVQAPDLKDPRAKRSVKKRKNNYFMLKLIAGWSVVLALIVFGARKMWPNHAPAQSSVSATAPGPRFTGLAVPEQSG